MNSIDAEWVIGSFKGDRAKSVQENADAGVGYSIIDSGGSGLNRQVVVAFRRAVDSPLPEHLQAVTDPFKIVKYEKMRLTRSGGGRENHNDIVHEN